MPYRTDLEPAVVLAEAKILELVHELMPSAGLKRIGPMDFGQPSWLCWVVTETDAERDQLSRNDMLLERLQSCSDFLPSSFTFQSEETVRRDFDGNWFYAMR